MSYKISYDQLKGSLPKQELTLDEMLEADRVSIDEDPFLHFESIESVREFVSGIISRNASKDAPIVYLVAIDEEIVITQSASFLAEIFEGNISSMYPFFQGCEVFIQEYSNYEDAYDVALSMKEITGISY